MDTRFAMKTCLVLAALALFLSGPLAAQVSLRPPPDTTTHSRSPDARAYAPPKLRHGHPWMGAAVGAAVVGGALYLAWRPSACEGLCILGGPSRGATAEIGAAVGALFGWTIGSAITTENRSRVPWRVRVGVTQVLGGHAAFGTARAP